MQMQEGAIEMSTNFINYKYMDKFVKKWEVKKGEINRSSLGLCLEAVSVAAQERVKRHFEGSRDCKLRYKKDSGSHYVVNFSCEFRGLKYVASGDRYTPPFIPVSFDMWIRAKSSWVILFDANRKLSRPAIALLSCATTGNPFAIRRVTWEKKDFMNLNRWLLSKRHKTPGRIERINLRKTDGFTQVVLKAKQLEKLKLFEKLTSSASMISDLSFTTPPLETASGLRCRMNHLGGIAVSSYGSDSELCELFTVIERL
jgi:hypothetical protein